MSQQIIIAEQARIAALLTDDRVDELIVAQGQYQIGDIFLGTVENVLPGIDAAFINIGESDKNGFIHVSDLGPLRLKKGTFGITELLEPKQKVLVQVIKEPTGSKGPRLSGSISIPGKIFNIAAIWPRCKYFKKNKYRNRTKPFESSWGFNKTAQHRFII